MSKYLIIWLFSLIIVFFTINEHLVYIFIIILFFLIFTTAGHVFVFPIYYKNGKVFEGLIWGSISGITISSFLTSIIVYIIGWNLLTIFFCILILPILLLVLLFWNMSNIENKNLYFNNKQVYFGDVNTTKILFICLTIITFFFYLPYRNLGILIDDKYLYAWLFGHDFINRMVHVDSLSRGIPLNSFFFSGETLSYYWLAYVFPALMHNIRWIDLDIQQLLQLTQLFYSLLTTAALLTFIKKYVNDIKVFLIILTITLCCYSYIGLYNIGVKFFSLLLGSNFFGNIGYKIENFSGFSHSLYRFFLVEPQGTLAIAIMLMIFYLYEYNMNIRNHLIVGILIGLLFGVEATNGIMIMLWFGFVSIFALVVNWHNRYIIGIRHFFSIICASLVFLIFFSIKMYSFQTGSKALQLAPNWFAIKTLPIYLPLLYGPALILSFIALITIFRKKENYEHWVYRYIALLAVGLFFVLFIQNPTEYHFGLLKATRLIPISLLMLTIYFFQLYSAKNNIGSGIFVMLALAFPSFISDNFIASDISNPSTFVRADDLKAAIWIKKNLPKDAIIQAEPNYPGEDKGNWPKYAYSFIPIFAERRTAIGEWKVSSQEHGKLNEVAERFHSIKKMLSISDLEYTINTLKKYDIQYVYLGKLEKDLYPEAAIKFKKNTNYFKEVFSMNETSIFLFNAIQ